MATAESNISNAIMIALSEAGCLVWRNNVGVLPDNNGRPIRYGLGTGSSDIIGLCSDGTFLAVEVKTKTGRVSPAQTKFIAAVLRRGGRAGVARSPADALLIAAKSPP